MKQNILSHPSASETANGHERRREPRRRVLKEARIIFNNRFSTVNAAVRDISSSGCRLKLHQSFALPKSFTIAFPSVGLERPARLVWQFEEHVGAEFLDETPKIFWRLLPY